MEGFRLNEQRFRLKTIRLLGRAERNAFEDPQLLHLFLLSRLTISLRPCGSAGK
jgi:hypothetical protein